VDTVYMEFFFRRKLGSNVPLGGTSTTLGNIGNLYPQWSSLSRLESTRTPESTPQVQKPSRRYICKWLALAASKRFGKFDWGDDDAKSLRMRGPCTCTLAVCYYSSTTHYYQRRRHESACFDQSIRRSIELDLLWSLHVSVRPVQPCISFTHDPVD